jgi:NOL1/NOP2/fmu family ribosome biogenesis protein
MCAQRQAEILDAAAELLVPGGRLVYSTCTFAPEEDEGAVAAFLQRHPDFVPEEVDAPWFDAVPNGGFRLWPHKLLGEGHFAAVLRRRGDASVPPVRITGEKPPKEWLELARELELRLPEGRYLTFGQTLYLVPEDMPPLTGLKVERPGLELGVSKKGRFEPAHALALWLSEAKNTESYSGDSDEIRRYLHGDVVPSAKRGWCLVQVDGYSLGWGKGDGSVLKNHYPKGLRK